MKMRSNRGENASRRHLRNDENFAACSFGWWLMAGVVCSERKVLLAGCWWLICSERKVLLAGG
jgi:hypothetical protein